MDYQHEVSEGVRATGLEKSLHRLLFLSESRSISTDVENPP